VETKTVTVVASNQILRETLKYWILSFAKEGVEVITSSFAGLDSQFDLTLLFIGSNDDFNEALKLKNENSIIAVIADKSSDKLTFLVQKHFKRSVKLKGCIKLILKQLEIESICADVASEQSVQFFTKREQQVLELIAQGLSLKEISYRLKISIHTVVSYRRSLYLKTGARSLQQLVLYATLHLNNF
jgi:DNA-binding NarL/FixJ family response regulator